MSEAPIGPELARRNRRLRAERSGWPAGAVETCEEIDEAHPDWAATWRPESTSLGVVAPAGFYATPQGDLRDAPTAYGVDAETVSASIESLSSNCPVCGAHLPVPPGSVCPDHQDGSERCRVRWLETTVGPWPW